jgi:hypothetical protein
MMRFNALSLAQIALVASVVDAQHSGSATTTKACASVSSLLASYASASPSGQYIVSYILPTTSDNPQQSQDCSFQLN